MSVVMYLNASDHRAALAFAAGIGKTEADLPPNTLNSPLTSDLSNWLEQIWEQIDSAVTHAWREGVDASRRFQQSALELFERATAELREKANDLKSLIVERIDAYIRGIMNAAIRRCMTTIDFGGKRLEVSKISIAQTMKVATSLQLSIETACSMAADASLAVHVEYSTANPGGREAEQPADAPRS